MGGMLGGWIGRMLKGEIGAIEGGSGGGRLSVESHKGTCSHCPLPSQIHCHWQASGTSVEVDASKRAKTRALVIRQSHEPSFSLRAYSRGAGIAK